MVAERINEPLLAIVGETASGKSALGLALAEQLNGEIICADSRTIYQGMDIGTAKPSLAEQTRVRHHCLDIVDPNQPFSAADFKKAAEAAMADMRSRGKLPIIVGGTGLYVDALLYDFQFRPVADPLERQRLNTLTVAELQDELDRKGITLPENSRNPRHLIRALETDGVTAERGELPPQTVILGLQTDRADLNQRIGERVEAMMKAGLEAEVGKLQQVYGWDAPGMQAIGYREWPDYFSGSLSLDTVTKSIIKSTQKLAKRQRTWFKRNNSVQWLVNGEALDHVVDIVTTKMNK